MMLKTLVMATLLLPLALVRPVAAQSPRVLERNVRAHEEFLASDALNGRGSGTRDEWIAATYIGSQLRQFGIEPAGDLDPQGHPGYVQTIPIVTEAFTEPPRLTVGPEAWTHGQGIFVISASSSELLAPLQKLGADGHVQKGAAIFLSTPAQVSRDAVAAVLKQGPSIVMVSEAAVGQKIGPDKPPLPKILADANRPTYVFVGAEAAKKLEAVPDGTPVSLKGAASKLAVPVCTYNAVGVLRGARPEAILLSSHLDHLGKKEDMPGDNIYNGADDDASRVTAVLELARALGSSYRSDTPSRPPQGGSRPKRTVYFICFGSEETGGAGARHFLDSPPLKLDQLLANLEFEMIGRPDPAVADKTLWLTGWERSDLGPELAKQGARLVADPHPQQNFFMRSDNIALARRGVVAQTVSSYGLHKQYHQPDDDLQHLDFAHLTASINSMVKPVLWLVNSDFKPHWNPHGQP